MLEAQSRISSWSHQNGELRRLWEAGSSPEEIATELGRSVAAVMTQAVRIGLQRRVAPGRKPRRIAGSNHLMVAVERPKVEYVDHLQVLADKRRAQRVCLMCGTHFLSLGPQNRICLKCKDSPEYVAGSRLPESDVLF